MQYAIIEVQGKPLLIDANEVQALEVYRDTFQECPLPSEDGPLTVCYGSYMPQRGVEPEEALGHMRKACQHWLGHVHRNQGFSIGLHDLMAFDTVTRGHALSIPFAAAILADDEVIERIGNTSARQAVSAFLRYFEQMDALTNVLNRLGVFALKGIERRHTSPITEDNWQEVVDEARAKRTAEKIV